jgi:very-short-patch-repair endonuclease
MDRAVTNHPLLLFAFVVIVFVLAALAKALPQTPKVRAKPLLTDRERAARTIIERVLPHTRVHVQVAMGALLQTERGYNRRETLRTRNRFSQKIVDFVIEDRASGAILALVELDDRSHNALRDRIRDTMTAAAGYRTIRLPSGRLTQADIAHHLLPIQPAIMAPAPMAGLSHD